MTMSYIKSQIKSDAWKPSGKNRDLGSFQIDSENGALRSALVMAQERLFTIYRLIENHLKCLKAAGEKLIYGPKV